MNKLITIAFLCIVHTTMKAQNSEHPFRAYLYNSEFEVFMNIDFYNESIIIPDQQLIGQLPGYLGKKNNSFCWLITSAKVKGNKAQISLINDYGSEDLTATLTCKNDSVYILKQETGSTIKVPKKGRWQKLPKLLEFKKK